jgi:four helix bundle protein
MANHKDLEVWIESMALARELYLLCSKLPREELYGLTSQIKRAAISVPSNIAEGAARNGDKEFIQFLYISLGSLAEIETQVLLANDLGMLNDLTVMTRIEHTRKLITGLIRYLKSKQH